NYTVDVTVTDDDGGSTSGSTTAALIGPMRYAPDVAHNLQLVRNGNYLDLNLIDGRGSTNAKHDLLANTTSVIISGADNSADALTGDFSAGMFPAPEFPAPDGIHGVHFTGGTDVHDSHSLTILGTNNPDMVAVASDKVTVNGSDVFYANLRTLAINTLD